METVLLVNPRTLRGPKRLKNLPPALRKYWQRVRGLSRHRKNPRVKRRMVPRASRRREPRVRRRRTGHRPGVVMAARARPRHHLTAHMRRVRAARKAARTRLRRYGHAAPRMRRRARYGTNPRRIRFRHNPRRMGGGFSFGSTRGIAKIAGSAGVGMLGAVGLDYLWQYASGYLPASLQTGYVGTAAKAGVALLAGWGASKLVGRQTAAAGVLGAFTVIGYQLIHQMIASAAPTAAIAATTTTATPALAGMNAYMQPRLGWTSPGSPLRGLARTGAYMAPGQVAPAPTFRPGGSVSASGLASAGGWG